MSRSTESATFTPWRIFVLALSGPLVAAALLLCIHFSPNSGEFFHGTVHSGQAPVITEHLVTGVDIVR